MLGYENPVLLREQSDGTHKLVGTCYVHGIADGAALLGPLPTGWKVHRFLDSTGQFLICKYFSADTGELSDEDPRLEPLPDEWERLPVRDRTAEDPEIFQEFRHQGTGQVINWDPRLGPEALKKRGVKLETFSLT